MDTVALLAPIASVGATRTSHRWVAPPGNWDRLNCRALFRSGNEWGIPDLPATTLTPARLVAYTDRQARENPKPGDAIHFFLDDYRFETLWNKPDRGLSRCQRVGVALTPDFSLWPDMPPVMQQWQVYRSRWVGCWLLHHGVQVIPTVGWSTPDSYDFAFAGIPQRSVVAVSTVGTQDRSAIRLFSAGYGEMLDRLQPSTVLVYGTLPTIPAPEGTDVRRYPTRWEK